MKFDAIKSKSTRMKGDTRNEEEVVNDGRVRR